MKSREQNKNDPYGNFSVKQDFPSHRKASVKVISKP
jgi:hypothetical protein